MGRLCLLLLLLLTACQVTVPAEPTPTAQRSALSVATIGSAEASSAAVAATPTWTPEPTLTPTPLPTATLTPIPTLTPMPTTTPTSAPVAAPVLLIERPLPNEFVPGTISVAGKVANATAGTVTVELRSPDGQALGPPPIVAATTVVSDGLAFTGELPVDLPPTPRPFTVHAVWSGPDSTSVAEASQPINLLGRFPRVSQLTLDAPRPFDRSSEPTMAVRGFAPGPPAKVLARLLDSADNVVESVEARLLWYQPGLPCAFEANLANNPAGTQVQVIMLGPDDAVLEAVRVRLDPPS